MCFNIVSTQLSRQSDSLLGKSYVLIAICLFCCFQLIGICIVRCWAIQFVRVVIAFGLDAQAVKLRSDGRKQNSRHLTTVSVPSRIEFTDGFDVPVMSTYMYLYQIRNQFFLFTAGLEPVMSTYLH